MRPSLCTSLDAISQQFNSHGEELSCWSLIIIHPTGIKSNILFIWVNQRVGKKKACEILLTHQCKLSNRSLYKCAHLFSLLYICRVFFVFFFKYWWGEDSPSHLLTFFIIICVWVIAVPMAQGFGLSPFTSPQHDSSVSPSNGNQLLTVMCPSHIGHMGTMGGIFFELGKLALAIQL